MLPKSVKVVPYDPSWPQLFADEARHIRKVFGSNCIETFHIGSTAVPGLSAKPIIDILPVVLDLSQVDAVSKAMEAMGYEVKGENGIPFRRYFQKGPLRRTYNVHVFEKDNPEIERHLYFRDWMRSHREDRDAYAKLKSTLAEKYPDDITSYCLGKDEFITSNDAKTGFNKLRIVRPLSDREWQAARHFRQKYFFDNVPIPDPYTWTFNHTDHVHFVLYQGATILGYAHIQLWKDMRAALRIIVIDEAYRQQGSGSYFLRMIEKWLKTQNILKLHIQSTQAAYQFYVDHAYIKMAFNDPEGHETHPMDIELGKIL